MPNLSQVLATLKGAFWRNRRIRQLTVLSLAVYAVEVIIWYAVILPSELVVGSPIGLSLIGLISVFMAADGVIIWNLARKKNLLRLIVYTLMLVSLILTGSTELLLIIHPGTI